MWTHKNTLRMNRHEPQVSDAEDKWHHTEYGSGPDQTWIQVANKHRRSDTPGTSWSQGSFAIGSVGLRPIGLAIRGGSKREGAYYLVPLSRCCQWPRTLACLGFLIMVIFMVGCLVVPRTRQNMAVDRDISSPHCSSFHPFLTLPNLRNLQEVYLCTYYETVTMYFRRLVDLATLALGALGAPQPPGNSDLTKRQCVDKWPIEQCAPYVQDCFDPSIGLRLRQNCAKTCGVCKLGCQSLLFSSHPC